MPRNDETVIADLLRLLPPAPEAWVAEASELPRTRGELNRVLPTIERDAELRAEVTHGLEDALATGDGSEPTDPARMGEDLNPVARLMINTPDRREHKEDEMLSEAEKRSGHLADKRSGHLSGDVEGHMQEADKRSGHRSEADKRSGHLSDKRSGHLSDADKRSGHLSDEDFGDDDVEGHMLEADKRSGHLSEADKRSGH